MNSSEQRLKYPPGFTPKVDDKDFGTNEEKFDNGNDDQLGSGIANDANFYHSDNNLNKAQAEESGCSGHFKKSEVPQNG